MINKKKKLKFLSESILLEESGLPNMNTIIVVVVSVMILLFIVWSNQLIMEESVSISGQVLLNEANNSVEFIGIARTQDINSITTNAEVYISVPGVTSRQSLKGKVNYVNTQPQYDKNNLVYYEVVVILTENQETLSELNNKLVLGMDSRLEIITGSKTMLQFLLGSLYDTGKSAFDIKE